MSTQDKRTMGFLDLPQEVRELIYDYAFYNNTRAWPSMPHAAGIPTPALPVISPFQLMVLSGTKSTKPPNTDLAILRVSRQVKKEALPVLYSRGLFQISFKSLDKLPRCFFSQHVSDFMRNVAIVIDHETYDNLRPPQDERAMDKRFNFVIGRLSAMQHPKRTCRILFHCRNSGLPLHKTAFCNALKGLAGFKTLTLQFGYPISSVRRRLRGTDIKPGEMCYTDERGRVQGVLQESLGPARHYAWQWYRSLEFCPQSYWANVAAEKRQEESERVL